MLKNIFYSCPTKSLKDFNTFAEKAADKGATHIYVCDLPKSMWQWHRDRNDPYPFWGMESSAIFKVVIPKELKGFLPEEYANKNLDILKQRGEILHKFGLKAAFDACEPGWLPEEVFTAYPEWRGARSDHPRRARKPYFSLCVDHPEVCALYTDAIQILCSNVPIEYFKFKTNDAGGGLCWSKGLYPGVNGPANCSTRTMQERVVGFLTAIQDGAKMAGINACAEFNSGINKEESMAIIPYLKSGQYLSGKDNSGTTIIKSVGFFNDYYGSCTYPVVGIPQVVKFVEQMEAAQDNNKDTLISFQSIDSIEEMDIISDLNKNTTAGVYERYLLLKKVATSYVNEAFSDILVDCWNMIYKGIENMRPIDNGGNVILLGCISQRWINRPFVPFPMELSSEEKQYYREFQFQANSEEEAADLMNLQGQEHINGYSGTWLATKLMSISIDYYQQALKKLEFIIEKTQNSHYKDRLLLLNTRIRALICFVRNAINAAKYQEILDRTDYSATPCDSTKVWTDQGDYRLKELQNIARAEIDNTLELIKLLEGEDKILLTLAACVEEEDTFTLGPDLTNQLRKKIKIMQEHWLDTSRLYTRFNN